MIKSYKEAKLSEIFMFLFVGAFVTIPMGIFLYVGLDLFFRYVIGYDLFPLIKSN